MLTGPTPGADAGPPGTAPTPDAPAGAWDQTAAGQQPQPAPTDQGQQAGYGQPGYEAQGGYAYPPPPNAAAGGYPAGYPAYGYYPAGYVSDKRVTAGVLGILLGSFGIHRFYLNDPGGGILRILITLFTCGIGGVIGLAEGIIYLTKSDAEFDQIYLVERKEWF
jgi:TM2 domain-containing membrane protein YozV